ncbi:hypothetical protein E2562_005302, partial [Oryza meyeriana var. granulata]
DSMSVWCKGHACRWDSATTVAQLLLPLVYGPQYIYRWDGCSYRLIMILHPLAAPVYPAINA